MTAARFQVLVVTARKPVAAVAPSPRPAQRVVTWRFLAANNRPLAVAATTFPDTQACLDAIRQLRDELDGATSSLVRLTPSLWEWRVRLAGVDRARSEHGHPRRVRARLACMTFLQLVPATETDEANVQVVYR